MPECKDCINCKLSMGIIFCKAAKYTRVDGSKPDGCHFSTEIETESGDDIERDADGWPVGTPWWVKQ